MKNFSIVLLSVLALGACGGDDGGSGGGGSGIPGSTLLKNLTPAQSTQLCHYAADEFPKHTVMCNGQSGSIGIDDSDCSDSDPLVVPDTCTATVADAEACFRALGNISDADVCTTTEDPAACDKFDADECSSDDGSAAARRTPMQLRASLGALLGR